MSNRIHILEITKSTGGVGSYIRWLANGLDKDRFQLTVVCLSEGGPALAADLGTIPGVHAFSLAMNRYKINPFTDARVLAQLARLIRSEHFDLIHAHTSKPGYLARLAAIGTGVPVIYRPACFAFHPGTNKIQAAVVATMERFAARYLTARITTVCDGERQLALDYNVGSDKLLTTIHTGIDTRPFDTPIDREALRTSIGVPVDVPLVGSVGRLSPQKAPLDFVRAAASVHARRPDIHFVWIGDGPLETATRSLVSELGLDSVFHFAGLRANISALLQVLDCFVLSSHWEGFSLVILEAMAARLPIVATRVMGTPEAIEDGVSGLLVPAGDPPALAEALLDLMSDPERAKGFGNQGRQRVERTFTRAHMIAGISKVYNEVYAETAKKDSKLHNAV